MEFRSPSFPDGGPIPPEYAFCSPDPVQHAIFAPNRNPAFEWSDPPPGTKSFALICHDPDVPSKPDDVNQEGREVPPDLPRVDFFPWAVAGLQPERRSSAAGEFSDGVVPRGTTGPAGPEGSCHGINDYTSWFAGDEEMGGNYFGYDGPCPPWNDSLVHHYVFTLYALDVADCPVQGTFGGSDLRDALQDHVLAQASVTGTYTLNQRLLP